MIHMCAPFIVCSLWQRLMIHMYRHSEHTIEICIIIFISDGIYVCPLCLYICIISSFAKETYDDTFVSSFLYLMVYMCAPCVCTYVLSGSLCLYMCIISSLCRSCVVHVYHQLFCKRDLWWYICVLPVSVHMYRQLSVSAPVLHMCIIRHKHMYHHRSLLKKSWWYICTDTGSLMIRIAHEIFGGNRSRWYICTDTRSLMMHIANEIFGGNHSRW